MDPLRNPVTEEEVAAVRTILQLRKLGYACAINNENSKVLAITDGGIDMDIINALRVLSLPPPLVSATAGPKPGTARTPRPHRT